MRRYLKITALLCVITIIMSLVACKDGYQSAYIYFELPEKPTVLDPQTASTDAELLIVKNIYEGLLRKNSSGAIACGVATEYHNENLTYTFKLNEKTVWSNDTPLTSEDFVFAFRRAVSPETKAPFASRLFCITNAEEIYKGNQPKEALGVSAPDSTTLVISLAREDSEFETTLTTSVAMPCNEQFFTESCGRYGLEKDSVISNGSYTLSKWSDDPFGIRLYSNDNYKGSMKPSNAAVFLTCDDEETALEKLGKNSIDFAFIDSSETEKAESAGLHTASFENICWVMTVSSDFSPDMRKAFAMLVGNEVFSNDLKTGYSVADSLFPSAVSENTAASGMTFYDLQTAKTLFAKELNKLPDKKFPTDIKLSYYDNGVIKPVITDIVGHWQNNLGAFVNIEAVKELKSLTPQLTGQTLSMAVFPIKAENKNLAEYIHKFGKSYSGEDLNTVQTEILSSNHIIPIAFQNTTLAYSDSIVELYPEFGNGYLDFAFIIKNE